MAQLRWLVVTATLVASMGQQALGDSLALETFPASVSLARGETARVLIVAQNSTQQTTGSLVLGHVPQAGIRVAGVQPFDGQLLPGTTHSWLVEVQRTADDEPGELTFHLSATLEAQEIDEKILPAKADFATAKLAIALESPTSVDEILEVRLESAHDAVQDYRPSELLLVLRNKSEFEVTIDAVSVEHPDSPESGITPEFQVVQKDEFQTSVVKPHEQRILIYEVSTPGKRAPGSRLAVFKTEFQWREHGQIHKGLIISSRKYELGVFGESALLATVGVPAFFLLPGFLFLTAFSAVVKRFFGNLPDSFQVSAVEFAATSVALSFLAVPIYLWATGVNYLEGYDLSDIGRLWFGALVAGLVAALAVVVVRLLVRLCNWTRRQWEAGKEFQETDSAVDVVRKLEEKGLPLLLQRAKVIVGAQEVHVLKLDSFSPGWVCPPIEVRFVDADDKYMEDFETKLDAANKQNSGMTTLLKQSLAAKKITLICGSDSTIAGPKKIDNVDQSGVAPLVAMP